MKTNIKVGRTVIPRSVTAHDFYIAPSDTSAQVKRKVLQQSSVVRSIKGTVHPN